MQTPEAQIAVETLYWCTHASPLGELLLVGGARALREVRFPPHARDEMPSAAVRRDPARFDAVRRQLDEYFAGRRRAFELPLAPRGSLFQLRVWRELLAIPYGTTISYGELAKRLGRPGAGRAVGLANGRNPLAIVVPCHRVIGADGSLTGYGGGIQRKAWLLRHEGACA
jgi:methylated-DNA-[protein]-cysteine S-methyltransferase